MIGDAPGAREARPDQFDGTVALPLWGTKFLWAERKGAVDAGRGSPLL